MFYVIHINEKGMPQKLFGPMSWDESISKMKDLVGEYVGYIPKITLFEESGSFEFDDGIGGFYVIQCE